LPDFEKMRAESKKPRPIRPRDIFNRLIKPQNIRDLLPGQVEVLDRWFEQRNQPDNVIKLNTGAGKTLVALLIAQSTMNELGGSVLYLCANNQLVNQTIEKAKEVGIIAERYQRGAGVPLPPNFRSGKAILVATYPALFNGHSKFGVALDAEHVSLSAIIFDDAHVELSGLRDSFTINISSGNPETKAAYDQLIEVIRPAFEGTGKAVTFEDIVEGSSRSVLEVPYWKWTDLAGRVTEIIRPLGRIEWPLIRDEFDKCHCLVGSHSISIVPIFPMADKLPSFARAPRRVFMSATISDDSVLTATFGLSPEVTDRAIQSDSVANVGERMILIPGFNSERLPDERVRDCVRELVSDLPGRRMGAVVITPSKEAAEDWTDVAELPDTPDKVEAVMNALQAGESFGPIVLANRYDGIDLPHDTCRLLVLDGKPQGRSAYENYRASILLAAGEVAAGLAQRIEQGLGRGSRGAGDACAVVLLGADLVEWIAQRANWDFMTASTRAQIDIGEHVSEKTAGVADLRATILKCVERDEGWVRYHQEELADRIESQPPQARSNSPMVLERKAFDLARLGKYKAASSVLLQAARGEAAVADDYKAWFLQMAGRYAWLAGDEDAAMEYQRQAYGLNRNLLLPTSERVPYEASKGPGHDQATQVLRRLDEYRRPLAAYRASVELVFKKLTERTSTNDFEEALKDLGSMLGLHGERPDKGEQPRHGPDVLWLAHGNIGFVIEAKNKKHVGNGLTREDHGQLLNACEWFKAHYPLWECVRIVAMPKALASKSLDWNETRALSFDSIARLKIALLAALDAIGQIPTSAADRIPRTQEVLAKHNLTPTGIQSFLDALEPVRDRAGEPVSLPLGRGPTTIG
jgi:tetratricopeptide (TPR) repeat protein